jgi:hypothetical protein
MRPTKLKNNGEIIEKTGKYYNKIKNGKQKKNGCIGINHLLK